MTKYKSFTLIEVIVSLSILSMILLSVFSLYTQYMKDETDIKRENKFNTTLKIIQKTMNDKYLNFVLSPKVYYLEYEKLTGVKNNNKIDYMEEIYAPFELQKLYDIEDSSKQGLQEDLWGVRKKDLEYNALKPYDILITEKITKYKDIYFPVKTIRLFDWQELENLSGFGDGVKECLFHINDRNEFLFNDFSDLNSFENKQNESCDIVLNNFITNNDKKLGTKIIATDLDSSYSQIVKQIKMGIATNYDIVLNKVEYTLRKITEIEKNLKDFARRENEFIGTSNELSIDHFVFCFINEDNTGSLDSECRISNYFSTDSDLDLGEINTNKIKFISSKGIWYNETDASGTITSFLNEDMKIKDLKNAISTFYSNNSNDILDIAIQNISGTTAYNIDVLKEYEELMTIELTGMVAMNMPYLNSSQLDGFSDQKRLESGLGKLVFTPESYKIFGLYDEMGTSSAGKSDFFDIPLYFTNVAGSSLRISNHIDGEADFKRNFDLNKPIIKNNGEEEEIHNLGPYSSAIVTVFPWIFSSSQDQMDVFNYGFYYKTITTSH